MKPSVPPSAVLKSLVASGLLSLSSLSFATPVPFTSLAGFLAATSGAATDALDDISTASSTSSPLLRAAGGYSYAATVVGGGSFYGAGAAPDFWLSTNNATDVIRFGDFVGGVGAIGGFFFGSDVDGAFATGSLVLTATDATGSITRTIDGATTGSFLGFVSTGALTSLTVTALQPAGAFLWPTVDDLVLARSVAQAVPEPSTTLLLVLGLGAVATAVRRRTTSRSAPGRRDARRGIDATGAHRFECNRNVDGASAKPMAAGPVATVAHRAKPSAGRRAAAVAGVGAALFACGPASAFNYVADANGTYWGIQDVAPPRVDTGSIRATQIGPGQNPAYSTTLNGFGGIRVLLAARGSRDARGTPPPRLNGELMRGFGLTFNGTDRFDSTRSVDLGGVTISRSVYIERTANWARWLDTFTNTTGGPVIVKVAFGGQSGTGDSGTGSSAVVNTSNGDAVVTPADAWVDVATPLSGTTLVGGPQVTVVGTPGPFAGAMSFAGNWLYDTFNTPLPYIGHERNFQGYVNTLTLPAGKSVSLLHFVVLGQRVTAATSATERAAVEATASRLAAAPKVDDLTVAQLCSIANFDIAAMAIPGFSAASCALPGMGLVAQPAVAPVAAPFTSARYDVVEKTIGQLRADLEAGVTTSVEITQAYLDRIAAYDQGPLGFNAFEIVATDAIEQARAADAARRAGRRGPLLGIPIGLKNLYDTKDMPTTNGSLTFAGFRPARDAFQVARLRTAGAVLIGKTALEEYATSGYYSNDAWGQVWNVYNPSKSPLASSGGSASALAASLVAGAMGSQTGDSLYAPASAASLVTLRGTDGLESGTGIMPLSWLTDFGGAMTRSVPDLADMLNVVAGTDPEDPTTAPANARIPADWRSVLDVDALRGARIGYIASTWADPFGTQGTTDAEKAALQFLVDAGATIVPMGVAAGGTDTPPSPPDTTTGNLTQEGWRQYIDAHPELAAQGFRIFTAVDVSCSPVKVAYTRADPGACAVAPADRMTQGEIDAKRAQRVIRQGAVKTWMDAAGVDAIVYPGLLSDISLNDGGGSRASFGRRDTPSASYGVPTVVFPAGYNDHGQPIDIQLMGRAWDDPKLVGYAYAFERRANAAGRGHVAPTTAPALTFRAGASAR